MAVQPERQPSRGHLRPQKTRCAAILRLRYQRRNKAAPPASPDELTRPRALLRAWTGRTTRRKSTHKERLFGSSHLGLSHKKMHTRRQVLGKGVLFLCVSAFGTKRTSRRRRAMSALRGKADI